MSKDSDYPNDAARITRMDLHVIEPTSPDAPAGLDSIMTTESIEHVTLSPPPRSARAAPSVFLLPPTLSPQPSIDDWTSGITSPPQPPFNVFPDTDLFTAMRDELASQKSFSDFVARTTSSHLGRLVATGIKTLNFLEGSDDVAPQDVPSVDLLYQLAPSVNTLSTNVPFGPSSSPPRIVPEIEHLCLDEANRALWSPNRTAETLAALRAPQVRELWVRNASLSTVARCIEYLGTIRVCVFVDDDEKRYLQFVDQRLWEQAYECAFIGRTSFIFNKKLADLQHLTVNGWMLEHELPLLFGLGFPARLKELHLWYAGGDRSVGGRHELLAYRHAGQGRCVALEALRLTTTRPLVAGVDRGEAPPVLPVERSLINDFLTHIHGREVVVGDDVRLELDGMTVSPA